MIGGLLSDCWSALALPGGSTIGSFVGESVRALLAKRQREAFDILLEEMRKGDRLTRNASEIDPILSMLLRYQRAAVEGTARLNLRLLAKAIRSQIALSNLVADEFLHWADVLATLRREEIVALSAFLRHLDSAVVQAEPEDARAGKAQMAMQAELVPSGLFPTRDDLLATLGALTRTGLVLSVAGWSDMLFEPTSRLRNLAKLAPLEEALTDEAST